MKCWRCRKCGRRERCTQSKPIKKSCPGVLKGHFKEESGFCFAVLFLKSTHVRILMLVAGGRAVTADVRVLKSAVRLAVILLWLCSALPLPSTKRHERVHVNVAILTYIDSPLLYLMATETKRLCRISSVRKYWHRSERSEKDSWLQRVFKDETRIYFSVWTTQWAKTVNFLYDGGFFYIYMYVYTHTSLHRNMLSLESEWGELLWS